MYLFMNTLNGKTEIKIEDNVSQLNRDIYIENSSCAPNGCSSLTTGTGYGTLAQRPTTCTAGPGGTYDTSPTGSYGVGYWATDANGGRGELYACSSTNTWTPIYEPLVAPHPLDTSGAIAPSCAPTSGVVPQTVTCTNPNSGTTVMCYAVSPTNPATNGSGTACSTGTQYTTALTISSAETLNVIAGVSGISDSTISSYTYTASAAPPTVTTTTATSITTTSATSGGVVTATGGASVTSEGVCYATSSNPTTPCTSNGTATPFTSPITGLTPNTTYFYRAFATNTAGTGYGSDLSFTTLPTCATPVTIGAFTSCGTVFGTSGGTSTTQSVSYAPASGNGVEIIVTYCPIPSPLCSGYQAVTLTLSDNLNSPETCFTQAPNSPYNVGNSSVPDDIRVHAFYCPSIPSGVSTFTASTNVSVEFLTIFLVEWKAGSIASSGYFESVDQGGDSNNIPVTSTSISTSATTVNKSDIVTAAITNCGGNVPQTVGSGYTQLINPASDPGALMEAMAVSSTGVQTATSSWSSGPPSGNCQLSGTGNEDTWYGAIVPLVGASQVTTGSTQSGGVTISGGAKIQ
jgi:hypothetical protein